MIELTLLSMGLGLSIVAGATLAAAGKRARIFYPTIGLASAFAASIPFVVAVMAEHGISGWWLTPLAAAFVAVGLIRRFLVCDFTGWSWDLGEHGFDEDLFIAEGNHMSNDRLMTKAGSSGI